MLRVPFLKKLSISPFGVVVLTFDQQLSMKIEVDQIKEKEVICGGVQK